MRAKLVKFSQASAESKVYQIFRKDGGGGGGGGGGSISNSLKRRPNRKLTYYVAVHGLRVEERSESLLTTAAAAADDPKAAPVCNGAHPTKQTERNYVELRTSRKFTKFRSMKRAAVYRALSLERSFVDLPNSPVWEAGSDNPLGGLLSDPM